MMTPTNEIESTTKSAGLFRSADGKNYFFIFLLVSSLFLLWGFCSGLLDNGCHTLADRAHRQCRKSDQVKMPTPYSHLHPQMANKNVRPDNITGAQVF